jgi:hypothetical protein
MHHRLILAASKMLAFLLTPVVTGCTIIQVSGGETSYKLGVITIKPDKNVSLVAYKAEGIGFVPGLNGGTIGYRHESVALAYGNKDCNVVIFENRLSDKDRRFWSELARDSKAICFLGEKSNADSTEIRAEP